MFDNLVQTYTSKTSKFYTKIQFKYTDFKITLINKGYQLCKNEICIK